ncbi:glycosyltransferase [Paracoccus sp. PARArs4]|uniref:glycosyltransferase family 8 protein n=1 Tax=Paracoccus sp. PARArs4 TaxID=2853442 RepID=UPI0024A62771|nr:glycosyltransferase [Paracoccus sp. PARArs4]
MKFPDPGPLLSPVYRRAPSPWTFAIETIGRRRRRAPVTLDVMTSVGGKDADVVQVMLQSLCDSHPRDRIRFWLFHLHLGPEQIAGIERFCAGLPNLDLHVVHVTRHQEFAELSKLGQKPFGARFLWYLAHEYLPADLDRVIYLDPLDVIVMDDLVPFLNQPLLGRMLAACRELPFRPPLLARPVTDTDLAPRAMTRTRRIGHGLINSGAMVLNLVRMRREDRGLAPYLDMARMIAERTDMPFGDQGLFSMTHGSDYARAHDRYNLRFHMAPPGMFRPAMADFAGRIAKPFHLRLNDRQERLILDRIATLNRPGMPLNATQNIKAQDLPYYRLWWEICARTPVHDRIAPLADRHAARLLDDQPMRSLA